MARRRSDTLELDDGAVVVTSEALAYEMSEDLLPEIMGIVSSAIERVAPAIASGEIKGVDDVVKLLPALGAIASRLGDGRLKFLAPKILSGTSVVMPDTDGAKVKYDLVKKDDRAACFEARPDLYLRILFFAGKVTFGGFFRASGLRAKDSPKAT